MKGTILVVDDDRSIQEVVRTALEEEGYRVLAATDGDALTMANRERPDVLLLDVMMPEMDGIEVSRRLRAQPATGHIRIVAMTAVPAEACREGMLADDWLPKPFDLDDLYAAVERWVPGP